MRHDPSLRPPAMGPEPVELRTADGVTLAARLFRPTGTPRAAVVLHGATGVPMGYYRAFATWAAESRGLAVLTYDYRDFAASARSPLRRARATMADWGLTDQAAALGALGGLVPGAPRWVIGHSLGGLMLGHHPAMRGVARVVTVGAGLPHVTDHPMPYQLLARTFWAAGPLATALLGYLPGRAMGLGADLPAGVFRDWRRWCLSPGFHLSDIGRRLPLPDPALVTAAMRVVAVADDPMVTPAATWRLMALYPRAVKRQAVLRPEDFGLRRIGHLGAFARANAALWPALVD